MSRDDKEALLIKACRKIMYQWKDKQMAKASEALHVVCPPLPKTEVLMIFAIGRKTTAKLYRAIEVAGFGRISPGSAVQ